MLVLNRRVDVNDFYRRLAAAGERVLMLDYDGTLAPFRIRPEQAFPYPGVADLLETLMANPGNRVVIVSGRRAEEVAALLPDGARPEIWGGHGCERLVPGRGVQADDPPAEVTEALAQARLRASQFQQGSRIERKPASIAVHWRGLPVLKVARLRAEVEAGWRPLTESGTLEWLSFDGGVELRARGITKEHAVRAVLAQAAPDAAVAYLGDDLTDEDAFRAVKEHGLAVLVRPECRETAADLWIRPPHELLEFLARWRGNGTQR